MGRRVGSGRDRVLVGLAAGTAFARRRTRLKDSGASVICGGQVSKAQNICSANRKAGTGIPVILYTCPLVCFPHTLGERYSVSDAELPSSGKKEHILSFCSCCTADSQTDAGRHQLYNTGSLVLFSTACELHDWYLSAFLG